MWSREHHLLLCGVLCQWRGAMETKGSAERWRSHSGKKMNSNLPSVYNLRLEEEDVDIDGCRKFNFGKKSMRQNRTIMLLGATGSGKSTLINGMFNYVVGVDWNDSFRFKIIDEDQSKSQAHSQTSEVTVYEINHQEGFKTPFSLTVVDTPGFGDTRGVARDKEITEQIRRLFTSSNGVSELDAVCFVTQASLARLTATQIYVFDSVLSIFGKDVAENIEILVTFADGKQPPVLEAINVSGIPCPKNELGLPVHFKFNNSALFADNKCNRDSGEDSDEDNSFDEMFWKMGTKSMEKFFTALGKMKTKSLLMTQEVLNERKHLETAIEGLQPQVRAGLAKLQEIKTTQEKIKEHETVMTSNENFVIEVDVIQPVKKQLTEKGAYITNCQKCSTTCHYPCAIANDNEKRGCASMDRTGMCTVCPGKCIWSVHFNQTYRWEYVTVKEKQTLQELKHKYEKASNEKMTIQELIERQEEEIVHFQDVMLGLIDQSAQSITRLQEIALRPNPLTTPEYIDMMIEGEKSEVREGYQARIQSLEAVKERAKLISKVAKRDKLTKTEGELSEERQEKKNQKGTPHTPSINCFNHRYI
uniref:AIG1-type G domain-containing protein n=1 Tax=Stegastes partitus TaxID=144197 RepID=A0A3B4ZA65_9TELE